MPPFRQAKDLDLKDLPNGNTKLSWNIAANTGTANDYKIGTDAGTFEIQRSTDSQFDDKVTESIGTVKFYEDSASYSIVDSTGLLNLNGTVYYRIRRSATQLWQWKYCQSKSIAKKMSHLGIESATAKMNDSKGGVIINWVTEKAGADNSKVWTTGSKIIIQRTDSSTSRVEEVAALDSTQHQYEDKGLTTCVKYFYSVFVRPGSSKYADTPAQKAIATEPLKATILAKITSISASKGYFTQFTRVEWRTNGNPTDQFIIQRSISGTNSFRQAGLVTGGYNVFDDEDGNPGVVYDYRVIAYTSCGGDSLTNVSPIDIGFRLPTGSVSGQVVFKYGDAEPNVDIIVSPNEEETSSSSMIMGNSYKFEGTSISYLQTDSTIPMSDYASLQVFVRPNKSNQTANILSWGRYKLGLSSGKVTFDAGGTNKAISPKAIPVYQYSQLTVTHSSDSLRIYIDSVKVSSVAAVNNVSPKSAEKLVIGQGFSGYLDEVRLWNRALSSYTKAGKNEISQTYNRLLSANENGLAGYWRFNEPVVKHFYDISYSGETYNAHHGTVYGATLSDTIPTIEQLCLRGLTDSTGYYRITGIPYVGKDGTSYKLTPHYGSHSFTPTPPTVVISSAQPSIYNIDFTDNSSVTIDGYVFYENSTIPVMGATFEIGGSPVTKNGDYVRSDSKGYFEFAVPVGTQTIRVFKDNHTFAHNGRLVDSKGLDLLYSPEIKRSNLRFIDQTKVKLIGRVAGGTTQESYPLGFSLSKNNIGDSLTIVLTLSGDASSIMNSSVVDSVMTHFDKVHFNKVHYDNQQIVIYPNNETGEYEALLYPVPYIVSQISAKGYTTLFPAGTTSITLDLSNKFTEKTSDYTDSRGKDYSISYNESFNRIYRNNTSLTFQQYQSGALDYYGDLNTTVEKLTSTVNVNLYNTSTKKYLFGYPVFHSALYKMIISAHEDYYYNNVISGSGAKVDKINLNGGTVTISNGFSSQSASSTVALDSLGTAMVYIPVDNPAFSLSGTKALRTLDMSMTVDGKNVQAKQLKAFVLGSRSQGRDYVTAGPINLTHILRDPPGSNSYSYLEKGVTTSYNYSISTGVKNEGEIKLLAALGTCQVSGIVAAGVINQTSIDIDNNVGAMIRNEISGAWGNTYSYSLTTAQKFQTSDDPAYVGADGDVFIGTTSNIAYGPADNVTIVARDVYDATKNTKLGSSMTLIQQTDDNNYYLVNNVGLGINKKLSTMFAYTQQHIKEVLIPNLEKLRNSFLVKGITESEAQDLANYRKQWVYLSLLDSTDNDYGKDNLDSSGKYIDSGQYEVDSVKPYIHYKIFQPNQTTTQGDTIFTINQSIKEWKRVLTQNEQEKLNSTNNSNLVKNYSFQSGSPIEYSEEYSYEQADTYNFDLYVAAGVSSEWGLGVNKCGFNMNIEETLGVTQTRERSTGDGESRTSGFVLADEGDGNYLSVDVYRVKAIQDTTFYNKFYNKFYADSVSSKIKTTYGNFIFKTIGGATSCPYEAKRVTEYYRPGTELDPATQQIEKPVLLVDNPVISNVPSNETAKFNLKMYSESETKASGVFTLALVDWQNQSGAKFSIDGVPLSDGRAIEVPYGDILNKVLEVGRGTAYDYDDLALVLKSQCDDNITDTVYLSVHFIPSSSDLNISNPSDKWTLNTNSPYDKNTGKYYMPVSISGYDVNFTGFDHIELQYKASSDADTKWTTICSFFNDTAKYKAASGEKAMINGGTISSNFFGADDQKYDIRAVSFSKVGNDFVTKTSAILSGTKDTKRPTVFGNLEPADGVLDVEDNIKMTFNEEIAEGIMTNVKNFEVTGIVNGTNTDHSTSLTFDGKASYLATQAERNLEGKDVTVEMWVMPTSLGKKMTLFSHGTAAQALELSIAADNTIEVNINGNSYKSKDAQAFKVNEWAHVAMTYNAVTKQLVAYFGGDGVLNVTAAEYKGTGIMNFGRGIGGSNYFAGKMHEARVWNKVITPDNIIANKLTIYTGQELGMMDYYPMNEGKGTTVTDKAQGATAWINGATWSTLDGMSLAFDGAKTYAKVNTSSIAIDKEMNYSLEFWFKAAANQTNAAIVSNGSSDVTGLDKVFVGFQNGKLIFSNNGHKETIEGSWMDDAWHHFAISVNRNAGNAQIFIDGALKNYFDANLLGGLAASYLNLGAIATTDTANVEKGSSFFKGQIDELQLWNMALPSTYIKDKYNVCPKGKEMGLMAYLPFSKYITNTANAQEMVYSGEDLVSNKPLVTLVGADTTSIATTAKAPVKAKGPEVSLKFSFVVNKDALVINLLDSPEDLEKTTVNITVKDVTDLNGNQMLSPVTWSAYINQNQLKWSETSITKEKKLDAAMTFTVDAMNTGGTEKNFTINNLPSWLTATPSSGTIDPLGKQTITFTVKPGTAIGHYDDVVYLTGENKVSESLSLTLKVFDNQPDWTPVEGKYSMNVYGRIRVEDVFSIDEEDMLGAFDGNGKCVGKATNQYMQVNDMWYVFMTVYSDTTSINNLSFRIWDASSGTVYSATPSEALVFSIDKVYGKISAPIVFSANTGIVQNISLKKGWNWVSFNVQSSNLSSVSNLMSGLKLDGDEQVKSDAAGTFSAYTGNSGKWIGTSGSFDNKHMYLLQSNYIQTLSIPGTLLTSDTARTLTLNKGWNYISYIPNSNLSIAEALSGYAATDGDIIKTQNSFSMYGGNVGWVGNLTFMQPGVGYMLQSAKGGKLVYPDLTTKSVTTKSDGEAAENVWTELSYETNMSIVATVAENLPLEPGDKLQAYSNGKLRGEAMVTDINSPLYFLTVGGTDNASVSFALERGGQIIGKTSPMFDYNPNNVFGSIQQPLIIDFLNDLEISVYPNPFENELNFSMNVKTGDKIRIQLFAMNGRLLHDYGTTATSSGYWHYRWDSSNFTVSSLYMAVVIINGEKHVYKVIRK